MRSSRPNLSVPRFSCAVEVKSGTLWRAFSLVEVVMALGIVSFCLMGLLALMPVGLKTVKSSREQSAAASLAEQMASGIRYSATNSASAGKYVGLGVCTNLVWSLGGAARDVDYSFTLGGSSVTSLNVNRLKAHVRLTPPADKNSTGTALVSVAWPQSAVWVNSTSSWTNSTGTVDMWIVFQPCQ